jgi:hypothetical protein
LIAVLISTLSASAQGEPQAAPVPAPAVEVTARAKSLFDQGVTLAGRGLYHDAELAFRDSFALLPRINTQFNTVVIVFRQDRFAESLYEIDAFLERSDPMRDADQRARVQELRARAERQVAVLTVTVSPQEAAIQGVRAVQTGHGRRAYLMPGSHDLVVSAKGFRSRKLRLEARPGEAERLDVALEPLAKPKLMPVAQAQPSPSTAVPWAMVASGGVLLLSAAVTGVLALDADHEVTARCDPDGAPCRDLELRSVQSRAATLATVTDVLAIAGGAGLAVGVGWLAFFDRESAPRRGIAVAIGGTRRGFFSQVKLAF